MKTFNFWANCVDFGNWEGGTEAEARNLFASDAGYKTWNDMIDRAEEFGGNTVEFKEVLIKKQRLKINASIKTT